MSSLLNPPLAIHPVADIFPYIQGGEFEELKGDIAHNGQREPITLHVDGSIIDGRNRYKVCQELGIEPKWVRYEGSDDEIVAFILSKNLQRRHLTSMQRAAIGVEILEWEKVRAKERQAAGHYNAPQYNEEPVVEKIPQLEDNGKSRDKAATQVGTNGKYIDMAARAKEKAPEVFEAIKSGALNGSQAGTVLKERSPEIRREIIRRMDETGEEKVLKVRREILQEKKGDSPPLPTEKYRVIYADPPWSYGNSGVINDESENYGKVGAHYPSMSNGELMDMGKAVRDLADDNAVLFLWVTSPLLEEAFPLIRSWGFKYKTSFVWDKIAHNFGHYNSVRHEFLLVCTRGSCTPDNSKLYDSVLSIEKSRKHSEKPNEFREIIDDLYWHGRRIELFARTGIDGWDAWGNEAGGSK